MNLTDRQREVLALLAEGLTNKEIAQRLALATQTVKNVVTIIYEELGVTNRAGAAAAAVRQGIVQTPEDRR